MRSYLNLRCSYFRGRHYYHAFYWASRALVHVVRDLAILQLEPPGRSLSIKQLFINHSKASSDLPRIPRLFNGTPWTSKLHLPPIHSLRLHLNPFTSPSRCSAPWLSIAKLTSPRTVTLEALTDVTTVYCTGIYYHCELRTVSPPTTRQCLLLLKCDF